MPQQIDPLLIKSGFSHEDVFTKIWRNASASNINLTQQNQTSIRWLANEAGRFTRLTDYDLKQDAYAYRSASGQMFMFHYFPKWWKTLDYYDIFPLVMPIKFYNNGFLGLNFHYITPYARLKLLTALQKIAGSNSSRKLELSYQLLNSAAELDMYKPCLKRYLRKQYRSKFIKIEKENWHLAIFLPVAKFQKKSQEQVWRESSNQVRNLRH